MSRLCFNVGTFELQKEVSGKQELALTICVKQETLTAISSKTIALHKLRDTLVLPFAGQTKIPIRG